MSENKDVTIVYGLFSDFEIDSDGKPVYLWGLYKSVESLKIALLDDSEAFFSDENTVALDHLNAAKEFADLQKLQREADNHKFEVRYLAVI